VRHNLNNSVAVLDSRLLAGLNCEEFLSQRENEEYSRFRAPVRKSEWLAGRLSSKFLWLNDGDSRQSGMLSASELRRFPTCMYRETEVVRYDHVRFGIPQVGHGNAFRDVAISHTNGIACSLLGDGKAIAIDMERVETRSPVFYKGNFTGGEKSRAAESFRLHGLDPHWTFTLLWSIKECLLKTPAYNNLSLWDMPAIDIRIVGGENNLTGPQSAREFSGEFISIDVEAAHRDCVVSHSVSISGRYDLVLTVIRGVDRGTM
jgi:hypothetical protein